MRNHGPLNSMLHSIILLCGDNCDPDKNVLRKKTYQRQDIHAQVERISEFLRVSQANGHLRPKWSGLNLGSIE